MKHLDVQTSTAKGSSGPHAVQPAPAIIARLIATPRSNVLRMCERARPISFHLTYLIHSTNANEGNTIHSR